MVIVQTKGENCLAALSVEAARGRFGVVFAQPHILGLQRHGTVFQQEARDAYVAHLLGMVERGRGVAKVYKLAHVTHMLTDIQHLETVVASDLLVQVDAMGTSFHSINLNHGACGYRGYLFVLTGTTIVMMLLAGMLK